MSSKQTCYCSFCKNERIINTKKRISLFDISFCFFAAILLSFVFWQKLDPRLMVIAIVFLTLSAVLVRFRWRMNIICPFCGFDPILYTKDPSKACERVKLYMEKRSADSKYVLSTRQFDKLAKIIRSKGESKDGEEEQKKEQAKSHEEKKY